MGIPVKVSMYNVGPDMKPTGKDGTTELGMMDSEQFVQIVGQIFEATPKDWASGYSPPSFMLETPSGVQGFHIWKGRIKHFQSDRFVNLAEVQQVIEAPPRSTPPPPADASAVNTAGPQFSLKVWKSDGRKTLFIVSLFLTGIFFLIGVIVWPVLLLFIGCLVLALVLRSSGKGELKAGIDPGNDAIWVQRPGEELVFEGHASDILGFTVEADVVTGKFQMDHHHHKLKVAGITVDDTVHENPTSGPRQVKVTWIVKAKRADKESLDAIAGGACVNKGEAEDLAKGLEGLLKQK